MYRYFPILLNVTVASEMTSRLFDHRDFDFHAFYTNVYWIYIKVSEVSYSTVDSFRSFKSNVYSICSTCQTFRADGINLRLVKWRSPLCNLIHCIVSAGRYSNRKYVTSRHLLQDHVSDKLSSNLLIIHELFLMCRFFLRSKYSVIITF